MKGAILRSISIYDSGITTIHLSLSEGSTQPMFQHIYNMDKPYCLSYPKFGFWLAGKEGMGKENRNYYGVRDLRFRLGTKECKRK